MLPDVAVAVARPRRWTSVVARTPMTPATLFVAAVGIAADGMELSQAGCPSC